MVVALILIGCAYVAHAALPVNALALPGQRAAVVRQVMPEGWAFFTRDPREADMTAWVHGDEAWEPAVERHHASPLNLFGLRRADNATNIEMGLIYYTALEQKAEWSDCPPALEESEQTVSACLEQMPAVRVGNATPIPQLCGPVSITRQEPLPWAWAAEGVEEQMPMEALRLDVRC